MNYFLIKIHILFLIIFLSVGIVFGYDNIITHPQITNAAIKTYQNQTGKNLTDEQAQWIIKGSIDEDADPRYLNHYYDPTTGKGLDDFDERFQRNFTGISAKEWAKAQSGAISHSGDYSESAILKNYRDENYKRAYQGIGHILHLIQDMSVPAHTRNDSHAEGDPYENWAKQNGKIDLNKASFVAVNTLDQVFDELALFSHNNFFSKSTVKIAGSNNYKNIIKFEGGVEVEYLINTIDGKDYYLAYSDNPDMSNPVYSIENFYIYSDYWRILHPKAVGYSAGMIDYFIKQFELIDIEKQQAQKQGFLANVWSGAKTIISNIDDNAKYIWGDVFMPTRTGLTEALDFTAQSYQDIKSELFPQIVNPQSSIANIGQVAENLTQNQNTLEQGNITLAPNQQIDQPSLNNESSDIAQSNLSNQLINQEKVQQPQISIQPKEEIIHAPYQWPVSTEIIHAPYQGGVVVSSQPQQSQSSFIFVAGSSVMDSEEDKNQQSGPENAEIIANDQGSNDEVVQEDEAVDIGQGDVGQENDLSQANSEVDSNDSALSDVMEDGASTGNQNQDGGSQDSDVDNQPQYVPEPILNPDINFYLTDYDVRKSDFTLNWKDENSVTQSWELQYKLAPNFDWQDLDFQINVASTDEGSVDFTALYDDLTYYFRLKGYGLNGNVSDWQYLQADVSSMPVVINEVAWMGTQASANDEWIELANKTDQEIDLNGWNIKSSYGNINITLAEKIAPNGFYLLERTNDEPIANIEADQIYAGDLNNPNGAYPYGQVLTLNDDNNDLIDQAYAAWSGMNDSVSKIKKTSERISIWASGMEQKNWKTYIGSGAQSQDADGNGILGTPKEKNSQADSYYYLPSNFSVQKDAIFLQSKGPYVSDSLINIAQPAELYVEPGTVLKFGYLGGLDIYGKLIAKGMTDDKIVFTSLDDDEYGGDSNGDDQVAIVNWRKIKFNNGSRGEFDNSLFRYAGNVWTTDNEVFYINESDVKISNSIFENMGKDILKFENSDANILNSEFTNNKGNAVYISRGRGDISGSVFDGNGGVGIFINDPSGKIDISGNEFIGNKAPIRLDSFGDFEIGSNQINDNDYNGILVYVSSLDSGNVVLDADIPFIVMGFPTIQIGTTLEMMPGTIIKFDVTDFHGMTINGTLKAIGAQEKPIIFTSLYDDEYGGDTNNDGVATAPRSGLWAWIDFAGSENSTLENVIIKYGSAARQSNGGPMTGGSAVHVDEAAKNFVMRNSQISNNSYGAVVYSDGAVIEDSSFSDSSDTSLSVFADNVVVNGATFSNNQKAVQSDPTMMANILLANIFSGNIHDFWPENLMNP